MRHTPSYGRGEEALKGVSILYVEDDDDIREELSAILRRRIRTLHTASNGNDGLDLFRSLKPDIVVTDIRMPVMDGLEMAAEIKRASPGTPIVVTTAYNEAESMISAIDIGIDKYVLKPTDPKILIEALCRLAEILSQKRELDARARFTQFILDISPGFIVTTERDELEYINKAFLGFLGYSEIGELAADDRRLEDFVLKVDDMDLKSQGIDNLTGYLVAGRGGYHTVTMRPLKRDEPPRVFLVTYEVFASFSRYILFFTDITKIEKEKEELRLLADKLHEAKLYAEGIVDTVHESLVVLDEEMRVVSANRAFYETFGLRPGDVENRPVYGSPGAVWDVPELRAALEESVGAGEALSGRVLSRDFPGLGRKALMLNARSIARPGARARLTLLVMEDITEVRRVEEERERLIEGLKDSLEKVNLLSGMLPICASCKKVRNDKGYWDSIEHYIEERSEAEFTHGICPACIKKLYPDFSDDAED